MPSATRCPSTPAGVEFAYRQRDLSAFRAGVARERAVSEEQIEHQRAALVGLPGRVLERGGLGQLKLSSRALRDRLPSPAHEGAYGELPTHPALLDR
jgi:hypothetical protein